MTDMSKAIEGMSEEDMRYFIECVLENADNVAYRWHQFARATTAPEQAHYLVELSNDIFSLSTYLPNFNGDTGEVEWEDE